MMKKSIFTIVAKNYIGLAQILNNSIRKYNNDIDFFIFVADEFEQSPVNLPSNVYVKKRILGYTEKEWQAGDHRTRKRRL